MKLARRDFLMDWSWSRSGESLVAADILGTDGIDTCRLRIVKARLSTGYRRIVSIPLTASSYDFGHAELRLFASGQCVILCNHYESDRHAIVFDCSSGAPLVESFARCASGFWCMPVVHPEDPIVAYFDQEGNLGLHDVKCGIMREVASCEDFEGLDKAELITSWGIEAWSPDGSLICFHVNHNDEARDMYTLVVANADESGVEFSLRVHKLQRAEVSCKSIGLIGIWTLKEDCRTDIYELSIWSMSSGTLAFRETMPEDDDFWPYKLRGIPPLFLFGGALISLMTAKPSRAQQHDASGQDHLVACSDFPRDRVRIVDMRTLSQVCVADEELVKVQIDGPTAFEACCPMGNSFFLVGWMQGADGKSAECASLYTF